MNIENEIKGDNFDVRLSENARFIDQKVTPDVLCIISECIQVFMEEHNNAKFSIKDIWESDYSKDVIKRYFGKPNVDDDSASSEYDKFFAQPINTLHYAGILSGERIGRKRVYFVKNRELLNFISIKERNALEFITVHLEKVLKDSDKFDSFQNYFHKQDSESFKELKDGYIDFIIKHTKINKPVEVRRIFTKVLNPLAFKNQSKGTIGGCLSEDKITWEDLLYNRRNFRDTKKRKNETRKQKEERELMEKKKKDFRGINLDRAKRKIKEYHGRISEVDDCYNAGDALQIHHIFTKADFPKLEAVLENLILLTPTQHLSKAHPANRTREIDKNYQKVCLIAKNKSIKKSIELADGFYSKQDFVNVVNTGFKSTILNCEHSFEQIEKKLNCSNTS